MKKLLLIALLTSVTANATPPKPSQGAIALSNAGAIASTGNVGVNNTIEAGDYSDLRIVPPAIAPSIANSVICPIITQGSKAGSVFFFSGSGTTSPNINAICLAWHSNNNALVHAIACNQSSDYKKANEQLGVACPKDK